MIIAMRHEMHGVHIAYSEAEAKQCAENGWIRDPALSLELAGNVPVNPIDKSLAEKYEAKFGKKPHHRMLTESIEAALKE